MSQNQPASPPNVNPAQTRVVHTFRHGAPLLACRFDLTGQYVFAGALDFGIHRWKLENNQKVTLNGHSSWVRSLAFVPQGNKLISGGYDGKLIWWPATADNPRPERTINEAHQGWIRAVAVSPNGRMAATCGNDNLVKVWSTENGRLIRRIEGHNCHVYNVAFHPSGRFLVSGDHNGVVKQWDLSNWREERSLDAGVLHRYDRTFRAIIGGIRGMAFNQDGSLLACAGIVDVTNAFAGVGKPAVVLFNWENGERRHLLRPTQNFRGTANGAIFHPNGFLASVGSGRGGRLWFWRPNQERSYQTTNLPSEARDIDIHPDGRKLAIPFYDRNLRVYEMALRS